MVQNILLNSHRFYSVTSEQQKPTSIDKPPLYCEI